MRENLLIGTAPPAKPQGDTESIFDYFPILTERLEQRGATLSGGEQQMLAIARARFEGRACCSSTGRRGIQPVSSTIFGDCCAGSSTTNP